MICEPGRGASELGAHNGCSADLSHVKTLARCRCRSHKQPLFNGLLGGGCFRAPSEWHGSRLGDCACNLSFQPRPRFLTV